MNKTRRVPGPVAFMCGAIVALVLGSGTAYAANDGTFRLGGSNSATKTTVLTNSKGTALDVRSKVGTAPLKVNRTARVASLNADLLDGKHWTSFALTSGQVGSRIGQGVPIDADGDGDGVTDFVGAVATCPSGTKLTGGGGSDFTYDGILFMNAPLDKLSWMVISTASNPSSTSVQADVEAVAQCWNPRGAVTGSQTRTAARAIAANPDVMDKLRARASH